MPDLINPEFNDGKRKIITWTDEKCASCKNATNCQLMQVIHDMYLLTYSGMHVSSCRYYDADVNSKHYLPPDASQEDVRRVNAEALQQELDNLNMIMQKVIDDVGAKGGSDVADK